jgi:hypothetical protein
MFDNFFLVRKNWSHILDSAFLGHSIIPLREIAFQIIFLLTRFVKYEIVFQ